MTTTLPVKPTIEHRAMLLEAWAATDRPSKKAELEHLMWQTRREEERVRDSVGWRRTWLSRMFGVSMRVVEERSALYSALPATAPLWERVDANRMLVTTAVRVLRMARGLREGTFAERVVAALIDYDKLTTTKDGIGRKKAERKPPTGAATADNFWPRFTALVDEYVRVTTEGLPAFKVELLTREMKQELHIVTGGWSRRVKVERQRSEGATQSVSRVKLFEACRTLGMDPPKPNAEVDMLLARKRKRALAKTYHPDVAGEGLREQYEAVLNAFAVVEDYATQHSPTP